MSEPRLTPARQRLEADCRTALEEAQGREEIIAVVRRLGLDHIADRLDELIELEAEEPDEAPMDIDSLRAVAQFVLGERDVYDPDIAVGPDGDIGVSWSLSPNGIVYLDFADPSAIQLVVLGPTPADGGERVQITGTVAIRDAMRAVGQFVPEALAT